MEKNRRIPVEFHSLIFTRAVHVYAFSGPFLSVSWIVHLNSGIGGVLYIVKDFLSAAETAPFEHFCV